MMNPNDPGRSYFAGGGLTGGAFGHSGGAPVSFGGGGFSGNRMAIQQAFGTGAADASMGLPHGFLGEFLMSIRQKNDLYIRHTAATHALATGTAGPTPYCRGGT